MPPSISRVNKLAPSHICRSWLKSAPYRQPCPSTSFTIILDDYMSEELFHSIVVKVGKGCGLRGIARQLEHRGDRYYFLVEGYDYQVRDYVAFFRTGSPAFGDILHVRTTYVNSVSDWKLPSAGFWCVYAPQTTVAETDSDNDLTGKEKLDRYLNKRKRKE